ISHREKDIRIRITNGIPEIILKLGKWGGQDQREEISILGEKNNYHSMIKLFGEIGYKKGVLCKRISKVYQYNDIEFSIIEVPNHSYFFEAEISSNEAISKEKLDNLILAVCSQLNLTIFNDDDYYQYIDKLNNEANEIFLYENYEEIEFHSKYLA
ncbi:MAG TPA: hypothetical protein PLQ36_01750, partial [Candidatus Gracilibacteria bacterium]|nr:hypothetical protein [Candidatus Gracilibacteria bacterium]